MYEPAAPNPDYCNALATSLWEYDLLRWHYHPAVRTQSHELIKKAPIVLSQYERPFKMMTKYDFPCDGELKPAMQLPKQRVKSSTFLVMPPKTAFVESFEAKHVFVGRRDRSVMKMRAEHGDD